MELPEKRIEPTIVNPRSMIIFSPPKVGKTTLLSQLDNGLIIDLEQGSRYLSALKVEINTYEELVDLIKSVKEANEKIKGFKYKYGIIDTVTKLEDLVHPLALALYKNTPMGKNYKGKILDLPNGAGYGYLRTAMNKVSNSLIQIFEHVIFVGHLKEKSITKGDMEITSRDLALTGKLASIFPANVDAVGFLHRDRKNNMYLNFQSSDELTAGARPEHLRGKDIEVATYDKEKEKYTYHLDRIFLPER